MSQVLQTNGDYTIKSSAGGIIKLDVGPPTAGGQVIITSDLIVEGETLTVEAENLNIRDNVIQLNFGETGAGVTLRYAGIQIDRGTETAGSVFFDENDDTFNIAIGTATSGSFNYASTALRVNKITSSTGQDLHLLGFDNPSTGTPFNPDAVVTVTGTVNYEDQVTDDDDIPNKKYVDDSIRDNPTFQIVEQNTRVIVTDSGQSDPLSGSLAYLQANTSALGTDDTNSSAISVLVDDTLIAQFFNNRLEVGVLEIGTEDPITGAARITSKNAITNANIKIETQGTGRLQTNYALQMDKIASDPADVSDGITVYAKTPEIGKTGVFFSHSNGTGEMISKNKALLLSMIF
jgi:hypothetical protein